MKTAIDWLTDQLKKQGFLYDLDIEAAKKIEKEQIINAFEVGYKSCDIDEAFEIDRKLASGELYYNKTYNL